MTVVHSVKKEKSKNESVNNLKQEIVRDCMIERKRRNKRLLLFVGLEKDGKNEQRKNEKGRKRERMCVCAYVWCVWRERKRIVTR